MNVLVADDDPTTRLLLKRMLIRDFNCAVTEVQNGMEALAALDERRYSALLLDVHMPIMGGLEALEAIRGSAHSSLPVVMLTAERGAAEVTLQLQPDADALTRQMGDYAKGETVTEENRAVALWDPRAGRATTEAIQDTSGACPEVPVRPVVDGLTAPVSLPS